MPSKKIKKKKNLAKNLLEIQIEILEKIINLVTTSLGVVAALAWNSTIQEIFKTYFPQKQNTLFAMVAYAFVISLIVITLTVYLGRSIQRLKDNLKKITEEEDARTS